MGSCSSLSPLRIDSPDFKPSSKFTWSWWNFLCFFFSPISAFENFPKFHPPLLPWTGLPKFVLPILNQLAFGWSRSILLCVFFFLVLLQFFLGIFLKTKIQFTLGPVSQNSYLRLIINFQQSDCNWIWCLSSSHYSTCIFLI